MKELNKEENHGSCTLIWAKHRQETKNKQKRKKNGLSRLLSKTMCNFLSNKKPIPAAPSFSSLEIPTQPIDTIYLGATAK